jgi:predicted AlkP superfamily pyrophosphatase or phosphodiesterase
MRVLHFLPRPLLLLLACAVVQAATPERAPVLLISIDAFRWDYVATHPDETPHLRELARTGVSAKALISVFPTQTFASHYSIATGLYPGHHGIVGNVFFDTAHGEFFNYRLPAAVREGRWFGGEPIWVTAVKQGRTSATAFWVGSEAEIAGGRPTYWRNFDGTLPFAKRLEEFSGWLEQPADRRPAVILFYLDATNNAGHSFGPRSAEVTAAIKLMDEQVGALLTRARELGVALNIVLVSDHGMAETDGTAQTIILDDVLDLKTVQVDFDGPIAGLRPKDGNVEALIKKLSALPPTHHVYRAKDLPARWHMPVGPRVPDVWIVPDPGWRIQQRSRFISTRDGRLKGDHGYDPAERDMQGFFIANGPAFRSDGAVIDAVENVHVYNLLCAVAGLTPAPNDGDDRLVKAVLAPR